MIAATLRIWVIAFLTVLLAGQQLACACANHHSASHEAEATAHDGHAVVDHSNHHAPDSPAPSGCEHCDHTGVSTASATDVEPAQTAQAAHATAPSALASELAWRLPVRSRERPPPLAGPPASPPAQLKTRLLI